MRKGTIVTLVITFIVIVAGLTTCGFERIDAGHVGIQVDLYGNKKGVQDVTATTGAVWYNNWTTEIYEFPTFIQNVVWTKDENEGSTNNEEITIITKDGMSISFDVGFHYYVLAERAVPIFVKYRKDLPVITYEFLRTTVRNSYNEIAATYDAGDLVAARDTYEDKVRERLNGKIGDDFKTEQLAIVGELRLPKSLRSAIDAKIKATEDALRVENEIQKTIAEAQKKVESAKGDSLSSVIRAAGEAEAYKLKKKELNDMLLTQQFIYKWNGKLPIYGQVPEIMRMITK